MSVPPERGEPTPAETGDGTLIIACGAIAREVAALIGQDRSARIDVQCLPPELHNRPERIAPAVRERLRAARGRYARMFVAYADCGTGGALDAVLEGEPGVERLPGAHCYEVFAGADAFAALSEAEPGTFYVTDFLARHFHRLVIAGLGLDRHPELRDAYFGNYRRLVYLAQTADDGLTARARAAAETLGLAFERRVTGYGGLGACIDRLRDPDGAASPADATQEAAGPCPAS